MRTKSQNGRRARLKGGAFEREVAELLRRIYPDAQRCIAQSRSAAREDCDVRGTPWWIECACGDKPPIAAKMAQAIADTDGRPPMVVTKKTRGEVLVTMRMEDVATLLSIANAYESTVERALRAGAR